MIDDPRVRLLNRLFARKSKELKDMEKVKNVEVVEERMDKRFVDDLLSCINSGDAKKQVKRQFVTTDQLQQQQKNKKAIQLDSLKPPQGGTRKSPQLKPPQRGTRKSPQRNKLKQVSDATDTILPPPPPLTEYEIERAIRV
ncbi:hypothetical protein POM88_000628 [Heracleum sosnowskyi]|uniref:Uncharacterized protein n=1 Tax=Heracleum sosnowskyi TaxID=360622 RepID=A0AAD8JDD1_9APIA|nr:hypothetical protein POM88_000628 [Heracleum sosnowskyi]